MVSRMPPWIRSGRKPLDSPGHRRFSLSDRTGWYGGCGWENCEKLRRMKFWRARSSSGERHSSRRPKVLDSSFRSRTLLDLPGVVPLKLALSGMETHKMASFKSHTLGPLVKLFLSRFFESDLTSNTNDFRLTFFAIVATLSLPGIVAPVLVATSSLGPDPSAWGWFLVARTFGTGTLRQIALTDKALYLGVLDDHRWHPRDHCLARYPSGQAGLNDSHAIRPQAWWDRGCQSAGGIFLSWDSCCRHSPIAFRRLRALPGRRKRLRFCSARHPRSPCEFCQCQSLREFGAGKFPGCASWRYSAGGYLTASQAAFAGLSRHSQPRRSQACLMVLLRLALPYAAGLQTPVLSSFHRRGFLACTNGS